MNQNLKRYALLAEIIGAVAIVLSLVFVGIQVRQSNKLALVTTQNVGTDRWVSEYHRAFGSEESTAFMRKAINHYETLTPDEKGRFFALVFGFVGAFDTLHEQHENGLVRDETYLSIARGYYGLVQMSGVQALFEEASSNLPNYLVSPTGIFIDQSDQLPTYPFLNE
jgi:hypothetical protein